MQQDHTMVAAALKLATEAHEGQWRTPPGSPSPTEPYVFHPVRVASRVRGSIAKTAALLHDVVEDTDITLDDLREAGYPPLVIETVDALTQRKRDETKRQYWRRVAAHPLAAYIKLQDIADNFSDQPEGSRHYRLYHEAAEVVHSIATGIGDPDDAGNPYPALNPEEAASDASVFGLAVLYIEEFTTREVLDGIWLDLEKALAALPQAPDVSIYSPEKTASKLRAALELAEKAVEVSRSREEPQ